MAEVLRQDPAACFGFIAAAMLQETSDVSTKRFRLYKKMLELKINPIRHLVVTKRNQSAIFVVPVAIASQPALVDSLIVRYESIFREAF